MRTLLTKEIREELYKPIKSIKSAIGRELELILDCDVGNEQSLIETFNIIKEADRDTLDTVFGGPKKKDKGGYSAFKTDLFSRLIRMALFNQETTDYLTTLKAVCATDDKDEKNLITYGMEGLLDSKRFAAHQPLSDIQEVRESLYKSLSSARGARGEECRLIADAPIHNEGELIRAFNYIHCSIIEDLTEDFGIKSGHNSFKNKMKETLVKIALFNKDAVDYVEQLKLCYAFPKKTENFDYYRLMYGLEYATDKLEIKADRVRGDKNPGFQHGGALSAFSMSFVGYDGMTDEEKEKAIMEISRSRSETVRDNPHNNPLRIEFYMSRGMGLEASRKALSERQRTFTLEKCVAQLGEEEGYRVWKSKQDKWQQSLENRSSHEKFQDLRGRASSGINADKKYVVYLCDLGESTVKFGCSSDIDRRMYDISSSFKRKATLIKHSEWMSAEDAASLENELSGLLYIHSHHAKKIEIGINGWLSTEVIECDTITKEKVESVFDFAVNTF